MKNTVTKPIITTIIPCYNIDKYIKRCIKSIQNQSYKNLDIIIINDNSTDNSLKIITDLSITDKRITIINNHSNLGQGKCRNLAIYQAKGSYLTFIDGDDFISDEKYFQNCIHYITNNSIDILITPYIRINNNIPHKDKIITGKFTPQKASTKYLNREFGTHGSCAKFFKTSIIRNNCIKFSEYGYSEEIIFVYYALKKSNNIHSIAYYGYVYFNDNYSSLRTPTVTTKHLYSSFRLLLEVLILNYKSIKDNNYIYI